MTVRDPPYFQWCLTECLAAPSYNLSAEPEHEVCGHSVHPFKAERQEATFANSVWEETLPDSNGLSALPIKSRAVSEISFKAPGSGKDIHFTQEERKEKEAEQK